MGWMAAKDCWIVYRKVVSQQAAIVVYRYRATAIDIGMLSTTGSRVWVELNVPANRWQIALTQNLTGVPGWRSVYSVFGFDFGLLWQSNTNQNFRFSFWSNSDKWHPNCSITVTFGFRNIPLHCTQSLTHTLRNTHSHTNTRVRTPKLFDFWFWISISLFSLAFCLIFFAFGDHAFQSVGGSLPKSF